MKRYSKRSLDNLAGVHPDLVRVMMEAIKDSPVDYTITEGVRSNIRQAQLYTQGRTKPGKIVTNVNGVRVKSKHQKKADGYGHAVDLYPYVNGRVDVNDLASLKLIAVHIKAVAKCLGVKLTWGGDGRSPYDPPHYQIEI